MTSADNGSPPKSGWPKLVCELLVQDLGPSRRFWQELLGFEIAYQRLDEKFVYLERPEGAQIMLHQRAGVWETAPLQRPFGRGVMFQVTVADVDTIATRLKAAASPLYAGPREVWRRLGDRQGGRREIAVTDPTAIS